MQREVVFLMAISVTRMMIAQKLRKRASAVYIYIFVFLNSTRKTSRVFPMAVIAEMA